MTDSTQNEGTAPIETNPPEEKPMTAKQFNQAMTQREKDFEKRLAKQAEDFQKTLERFAPPQKEEPTLSRTAEMERQLKEVSKKLQDTEAREKSNYLRKTAEQSLRANGIDADFTEHALAYLVDAKKAIRYDESGNLVMTVNGVEYDSVDDGMAAWSQSRDAKLYKRATGANGSGGKNLSGSVESFKKNGTVELRRREDADKAFDPNNPHSSLDRDSKVMVQKLLLSSLKNRQ